ncbi:TonB-dependent receptor [Arundinibacter roseus]|uniref:TonB-dependent receptor n=1 Tax=Arundinibacter roseus TaxID=2070510 RepID=A0A4R4KKP5_9BACT|nr:TonB-dependent receptor [Arundinibacter roseus]
MFNSIFLLFLGSCTNVEAQVSRNDTLQLDEVVVSASRFGEIKRLLPFQIEQIMSQEISFRNAQTSADVLAQSGQIFVQKSQAGGGSPILRGLEANRILLVVDGVRMNNAIFRGGHLQNVLRIDQQMIEQVEVVFGPNSVVYGSDALGGVIHFRSKMPTLSLTNKPLLQTSAMARYSSAANEKTTNVTFNYGRQKWGSLTSVSFSDFGDVRQGENRRKEYPDFGKRYFYTVQQQGQDVMRPNPDPNRQIGTAYAQLDLFQKVLFRPTAKSTHVLNLHYSTTTNVPRYDRLTVVSNGLPRFAEWYYGPEKRLMASYQSFYFGSKYYDELQVTAAFQRIEESRNSRTFGRDLLKSQVESVLAYSLNMDAQKKSGRNTFRYGLEWVYNSVHSEATNTDRSSGSQTAADTRYPDGGSSMNWLALYGTNHLQLAEKWFLQGGLRLNQVNLRAAFVSREFFPFPFDHAAQASTALTGNLGVVLIPGVKSKVSLLGSTGFRAPNVDDLGKVFDSQPGLVIVPNPMLKPEYAYNLEVSVEKWLANMLKFNGTVFHSWLQNALVTSPFQLNGKDSLLYNGQMSRIIANQNELRAAVRGMSLELNLYPAKGWRVMATYNVTKGTIQQSDKNRSPLDHIPPQYGKGSVEWTYKKWRMEALSMFNGWKRIEEYRLNAEDNESGATPDGMPSWWTLNLRAACRLSPTLTIQFAAENLLDTNYRMFASGVSAPGRNVLIALRASI